jgi:hypothetical protein
MGVEKPDVFLNYHNYTVAFWIIAGFCVTLPPVLEKKGKKGRD